MAETKRQRFEKLRAQVKQHRTSWEPQWRRVSDHISPWDAQWDPSQQNNGQRKTQKIVNNTATQALDTLASGMMSGLTSPARPWLLLTVPDPDLAKWEPAKRWLHDVTRGMLDLFHRGNLYTALPMGYHDLGGYGVWSAAVLEDDDDDMRTYPMAMGTYWLASSSRGVTDTAVREFRMTVRQLVEQFGERGVSLKVKNAYDTGRREGWIDVVHVVTPNDDYQPDALEAKYKRWSSCYYESSGNADGFLRESGYDSFPLVAPRWQVSSGSIYGVSPGIKAIDDVVALQTMEKRLAQGIEKMVNPPLQGPSSAMQQLVNNIPGGTTFMGDADLQRGGFRELHQVSLNLQHLETMIARSEQRIDRTFFVDLFLMLAQSDRRQITAREIEERHEEKLLMLGPVLERLNDELLDPLVTRGFEIMTKRGLVPPPPQEMEGMPLKVEYISILAQAQKMVGLQSIDRFVGFVGNLAQVYAEGLDKVNFDQAIDSYGEGLGVDPNIVRTDDEALAIRQNRAAQQAMQQQVMLEQEQAKTAKTLADADTQGQNALTDMMNAQGAA